MSRHFVSSPHDLLFESLAQASGRLKSAASEWQTAPMLRAWPAYLSYQCSVAASRLAVRVEQLQQSTLPSEREEAWQAVWKSVGVVSAHLGSALFIAIGKRTPEEDAMSSFKVNEGLRQIRWQLRTHGAQTEHEMLATRSLDDEENHAGHASTPASAVAQAKLAAAAAEALATQEGPLNLGYRLLADVAGKLMAVVENLFALISRRLAPSIAYTLSDDDVMGVAKLIPTSRNPKSALFAF